MQGMRRTSACSMIGLSSPAEAPTAPWRRSITQSSACWYERSPITSPESPTDKRAMFIIEHQTHARVRPPMR
jgi:hypothetical protein